MFDKIIKFSCLEEYIQSNEKDTFPVPVKLNVPEWFKKMKSTIHEKTVKGCMPFLDSLTTGYLLKVPQDIKIFHGYEENTNGVLQKTSKQKSSFVHFFQGTLNLNFGENTYVQYPGQVKGWPTLKNKNQGGPIHKIMNPWTIITPPGYSCLFLPVLNNNNEKFEIIPGIVDTDTYNQEINFPFLLHGFKEKEIPFEYLIKRGTPYCQIIPFKRESWKMEITPISAKKLKWTHFLFHNTLIDTYKKFFWQKKSYK